ncbi:hypothetical protein V9T40_007142 [Parthenolecanium corni]|uniref:Uncharacterized protein n=1 Tax=Parthenolecanium corni TaxID=536013 RepID=A0AAN9YBC8_9HEMI
MLHQPDRLLHISSSLLRRIVLPSPDSGASSSTTSLAQPQHTIPPSTESLIRVAATKPRLYSVRSFTTSSQRQITHHDPKDAQKIQRVRLRTSIAALETLTYLCLFFFIFFCFPPNASCRRLNSSSVEEHPRAASSGARTRAKTRKKNGRTSGGDGDAMAGGVEGAGKVESVKNIRRERFVCTACGLSRRLAGDDTRSRVSHRDDDDEVRLGFLSHARKMMAPPSTEWTGWGRKRVNFFEANGGGDSSDGGGGSSSHSSRTTWEYFSFDNVSPHNNVLKEEKSTRKVGSRPSTPRSAACGNLLFWPVTLVDYLLGPSHFVMASLTHVAIKRTSERKTVPVSATPAHTYYPGYGEDEAADTGSEEGGKINYL